MCKGGGIAWHDRCRIGIIPGAPAAFHAGVCGNLTEDQMVRRVRAEHGMSPLGRAAKGASCMANPRRYAHACRQSQRSNSYRALADASCGPSSLHELGKAMAPLCSA
jgi:hypothetical protein